MMKCFYTHIILFCKKALEDIRKTDGCKYLSIFYVLGWVIQINMIKKKNLYWLLAHKTKLHYTVVPSRLK